jgi:WD40 repeat protein
MATPTASRKCSDCGTILGDDPEVEGLCPSCLLRLAIDSPTFVDELNSSSEAPTLQFSAAGLVEGQTLGNRYRVRSLLGRGGMGEVWRAFDLKLRVDLALKALRQELLEDKRALEALRQEVRTAREVISPNVCRVFDLVELDGQELVSMEYIDGVTLADILKMRAPLELAEAREIASQFLAGLESIHEAGLVHRDMKPENVMMTRSGRVVVMDLGIAKGLADRQTGTVSGTPAYMAPEQARGESISPRVDVYSAGVVLAEMIAPGGLRTVEARQQIWQGVRHEPPELPDSPWAPVLKKAVAHIAEQRYSTASALARALEEVTLRVAGAEGVKPYPGLASFSEEDAEYFFGRELEVEQMWKRLHRSHLLGLIGPSGAGKSSFLRAGLLPVIPTGWRAAVTTPGNRPFTLLGQALVEELAGDSETMKDLLRFAEPDVAVSLVSRWRQQHDQVLIVIDQFEELFTQNPEEEQARFAELLGRLVVDSDAHVLVSMRDDFLFHCHSFEALHPVLAELTLLGAPTGAALRRAVVQPALKCGYRFEDESLVEEMVGEVSNERGALPMLAFAAARLWDHRDRDQGLLTREAYEHIAGVGGALAQHAEATLEKIGQDRIPIVRELFRNLVTAQGTRAARDRDELLSVFASEGGGTSDVGAGLVPARAPTRGAPTTVAGSAEAVLDTLIDARLLTSYEVPAAEEDQPAHQRTEIIHESLLSNWPRLVRWQTQDADSAQLRDQIRQSAQMWEERGRPEDLLWTGTSYGEFRLWRERYEGGLSAGEEAFGDAMAHRAESRKRRRRMVISAAFTVLLSVLGVIAYFGWQAELARRRAEAETLRAEAGKLIALGEVVLDSYPTETLAWATKSLELADTLEGRKLALRALYRGPPATVLAKSVEADGPGGISKLAFSPSGEWLASAGQDNVVLRSRDGREPTVVGSHERTGDNISLAFAADDVLVSQLGQDSRWWSVPGGGELRSAVGDRGRLAWPRPDGYFSFTVKEGQEAIHWWPFGEGASRLVGSMEPVNTKDIDSSGSLLTYARGKNVYVRSLEDWSRSPRRLGVHPEEVVGLAFHPNGRLIAGLDRSKEIRIWPTTGDTAKPTRKIRGKGGWIHFDPSGRWLATYGFTEESFTVWLWDLEAPQGIEPLALLRSDVFFRIDRLFHPSQPWLVTADYTSAGFWPLAQRQPWTLRGNKGSVTGVAFTPDGEWLVSKAGGELRAWPLAGQNDGAYRTLVQRDLSRGGFDIDPTGRLVAVGTQHGSVLVVPLAGGPPRELTGWDPSAKANAIQVAFSPGGRFVAAVPHYGAAAEMVVRVWDLASGEGRVLGSVTGSYAYLGFIDDQRLRWIGGSETGEGGGERIFHLEDDRVEILSERGPQASVIFSRDGSSKLTCKLGEDLKSRLVWTDLETGTSRLISSHGDGIATVALDPTDQWLLSGGLSDGLLQISPVSGGDPHLFYGHQGLIRAQAVSPDGRWIASGGDDGTVRLWPMPNLSAPPFHAQPLDELLATLHSLTNLRVVEDPTSSTGWKVEVGPFPGWEKVPRW